MVESYKGTDDICHIQARLPSNSAICNPAWQLLRCPTQPKMGPKANAFSFSLHAVVMTQQKKTPHPNGFVSQQNISCSLGYFRQPMATWAAPRAHPTRIPHGIKHWLAPLALQNLAMLSKQRIAGVREGSKPHFQASFNPLAVRIDFIRLCSHPDFLLWWNSRQLPMGAQVVSQLGTDSTATCFVLSWYQFLGPPLGLVPPCNPAGTAN